MKAHLIVSVFFAFAVMASSLPAETANERDFKQLRANRDKAAAAALDPINRRYKDELDKLFKKATQGAELDLARQIQGELQAVGGAEAAKSAGGSPAGVTASTVPADKTDLRNLIENSEWLTFSGPKAKASSGKVIFGRNGNSTFSGEMTHASHYVIEAPDILKTFGRDPKKEPKAPHHAFRVNMVEKTATKDLSLSTQSGDVFMKYNGPAKAAK